MYLYIYWKNSSLSFSKWFGNSAHFFLFRWKACLLHHQGYWGNMRVEKGQGEEIVLEFLSLWYYIVNAGSIEPLLVGDDGVCMGCVWWVGSREEPSGGVRKWITDDRCWGSYGNYFGDSSQPFLLMPNNEVWFQYTVYLHVGMCVCERESHGELCEGKCILESIFKKIKNNTNH